MRFRLLALAAAALTLSGATRAAAMTFETVSGPDACAAHGCVLASGDIDDATAQEFRAFVAREHVARGALVVLDSGGGRLMQSLTLGNEIRSGGFSTTVRTYDRAARAFRDGGECASACVYAFLGGLSRTAASGAKIGVHQPAVSGDDWAMTADDGLWLMSKVAAHIEHLCGSVKLLIPAMSTSPKDMHWLSAGELTRYAVLTQAPSQS